MTHQYQLISLNYGKTYSFLMIHWLLFCRMIEGILVYFSRFAPMLDVTVAN